MNFRCTGSIPVRLSGALQAVTVWPAAKNDHVRSNEVAEISGASGRGLSADLDEEVDKMAKLMATLRNVLASFGA